MSIKQKEEFNSIVEDIQNNQQFNKLNKELHHGITRYEHSMRVARWTYKICKLFKMHNKEEVTRAALLHDFYVNEDLVSANGATKLGEHPNKALENSLKYSQSARSDASTSETVPVIIRVPLKRSTNPISAPDAFIAISAAIIAVSDGDIVTIPIEDLSSRLGSSPSFL